MRTAQHRLIFVSINGLENPANVWSSGYVVSFSMNTMKVRLLAAFVSTALCLRPALLASSEQEVANVPVPAPLTTMQVSPSKRMIYAGSKPTIVCCRLPSMRCLLLALTAVRCLEHTQVKIDYRNTSQLVLTSGAITVCFLGLCI